MWKSVYVLTRKTLSFIARKMRVIDHLLAKISSEIVMNLRIYNKRISFFERESCILIRIKND